MKKRSFRVFAEKEDLRNALKTFQTRFDVYYVPTYSDQGPVSIDDITADDSLGINFHGSHIGNRQVLAMLRTTECRWRSFEWHSGNEGGIRYSSLCDENRENILIDLNGVYQGHAIFPTTVSTMYYDNETVKSLYDGLRQIFRKLSVKSAGTYICPCAYEHRDSLRFCMIDIQSPPEYDLKVD